MQGFPTASLKISRLCQCPFSARTNT
ncbi:hypothetical protein CVT26_014093, partial [Gymnopilus dilepis]